MSDPYVSPRRRSAKQLIWTLVAGFALGALFSELSVRFLSDGALRSFLTTSVSASISPSTVDLAGVSLTFGVALYFNVLTLVGLAIVAFVVRLWL